MAGSKLFVRGSDGAVQLESDIISTRLDVSRQALRSLDMQILDRLTNKR